LTDAVVLIIGNEILAGYTQDTNSAFLARALRARGVRLLEVRTIADVRQTIVDAVRVAAARVGEGGWVFTCGGIGPTPDDLTRQSVAEAFGRPLVRFAEAVRMMEMYRGGPVSEMAQKMADLPEGSLLLANPTGGAPGFQIERVVVLPGIPQAMEAIVQPVLDSIQAPTIHTQERLTRLFESVLTPAFEDFVASYPELDLGSYPQTKGVKGTLIRVSATDALRLQQGWDWLMAQVDALEGSSAADAC